MSNIFAEIEALSKDRNSMIDLVSRIDGFVNDPSTFTPEEKEAQLKRAQGDTSKVARINAIYALVTKILTDPSKLWNKDLLMSKIETRYPASN
jgi:hypothetical protein